jgi:hypothetical protein
MSNPDIFYALRGRTIKQAIVEGKSSVPDYNTGQAYNPAAALPAGYLSNVEQQMAKEFQALPTKYDKSLGQVGAEQSALTKLADFSNDLATLTSGFYGALGSVPEKVQEPTTPDDLQEYLKSQPGFEAQFKQGAQELQRGLAAKGLLGSGQGLLYAQNYSQDAIQKAYQEEINRLSQVAGTAMPFINQQTATSTLRAEAVRQAGVAPTILQGDTNTKIGRTLLDAAQTESKNKLAADSSNQDAQVAIMKKNGTF